LARRLAKHACSTIYRCLALTQLLCRWRHQSGNFWINPRISYVKPYTFQHRDAILTASL